MACFNKLVGDIYDAALDSKHWENFMPNLVEVFNAKSCMLRVQHARYTDVGSWISYNMDPHYQQLYREHFVTVDPVPAFLKNHPASKALQSEKDMPGNFRNSEFFNDYIKPQKTECLAGSNLSTNASRITIFAIRRPDSIGAYTEQEMQLLGNITPHMQRAIKVNQHLLKLEEKTHITSNALDRLPIGIVFVDANCKAVYANRKFEKLISHNKGLSIKSGKLKANNNINTNVLNKLIYTASKTNNKQGGSIFIENAEKAHSLNILVTPISPATKIRARLENLDSQVIAALFVSATGQQNELPTTILKELYGLTDTEAQLAASLANGDSLDIYAEKQGVSKNTVRNQLKTCFHKTGVSRQAELVALILSGIPALSEDITNFTIT